MSNKTGFETPTIIRALDVLCPVSIMSFISFSESILNKNRVPFPYISFRTLDVMLKNIAFMDISQLIRLKLDDKDIVSLYNCAKDTLDKEEDEFINTTLVDSSHFEGVNSLNAAFIHLTNHQNVKIPDPIIIVTNWMRLEYLLNVVALKHEIDIKSRLPKQGSITTVMSNLLGTSCRNIYLAVCAFTQSLLESYKDSPYCSVLKDCKTKTEYQAVIAQVVNTILTYRKSTAAFLHDVSSLLSNTASQYNLEQLMNLLSQSICDFRNNYSTTHQMALSDIPELQTSSYRYESPLMKYPLVQVDEHRIIPNFYDLFTCLREFPFRFNEYLDSELNASTMNTMGLIYEYYIGDLLDYTLGPERYIIIPEFEYQRNGSVVKSPDFIVIDRIDLHVLVIEVKGTRTSNVVRDDPASLRTKVCVDRVRNVLKKTLTKIDELFLFVGDYAKHRELLYRCNKDKTTILLVQKDFGVMIPSLVHEELAMLEPTLSYKCKAFNYCLIDIPFLETILHNHKATGKPLINYLRDYHNIQNGQADKNVSAVNWIPCEYNYKDLIFLQASKPSNQG